MTEGYGVEPEELKTHANRVRDQVGSRIGAAHEAARYEPGLVEMGILGFVITQLIDLQNDTDTMIELTKEFGEDITDRVENAGQTYRDIEDENIEILERIDQMPDGEPIPSGPGTPSTPPPDNGSDKPDHPGDDPDTDDPDAPPPDDTPEVPGSFDGDGVRIRTDPADGTILGLGYRGHDVTVHEVDRSRGDEDVWVRITDNTTGRTGWSHGDYVRWNEPGSTGPGSNEPGSNEAGSVGRTPADGGPTGRQPGRQLPDQRPGQPSDRRPDEHEPGER